ncbi:MAG: FecR family protein [Syntrophorhabdaceae bacterium]
MFLIAPTMVAAADAGYSAIVMDVKGKVSVQHAGKSKTVNLGCLLYPDDSLETAKEATLTVTYLESGQEEQWAGGARFVVGKDGSKPAPGKIKKRDKISVPQIASPQKGSFSMKRASPQQAGGFVMKSTPPPQSGRIAMLEVEKPRDRVLSIGIPAKAQVLGLSNTRILDEKPIFRWHSTASAQYYQIEVYNLSEDEPLCQNTTTTAELPFPSHMSPLIAGGEYKWVVTAYKDGRSVAQRESCFGLPRIDELTEIRKVVNGYREQLKADQEDTAARLRFALFLEGRQLYDEALEQYEVLKRSHGESDFIMERQQKIIELRNRPCPY